MNKIGIRWTLMIPIGLLVALIAAGCDSSDNSAPVSSGIVKVSASGGGDFTSIQAAVDDSAPGTMIAIEAGRYDELVIVDKSVTLSGSGSATVLAQSGPPSAFPDENSDNSTAVLIIRNTSGVSVQNMRFSGPQDGISVRSSSDITLTNVDASDNGDDGIDVRGSRDVTISGTFDGNGDKGVQVREGSSQVTVTSSDMRGNVDRGLRVRDSSNVAVDGCTAADNGDDGMMVRDSSGVSIRNSSITDNAGYGIRIEGSPDTVLDNNVLSGNREGDIRRE